MLIAKTIKLAEVNWQAGKFGNAKFRDDVNNFTFDKLDVNNFKETIFNIFDKHAPIKQKYLRANEAPFMTKELHREIIKDQDYVITS